MCANGSVHRFVFPAFARVFFVSFRELLLIFARPLDKVDTHRMPAPTVHVPEKASGGRVYYPEVHGLSDNGNETKPADRCASAEVETADASLEGNVVEATIVDAVFADRRSLRLND